jgi:hypothetical protein
MPKPPPNKPKFLKDVSVDPYFADRLLMERLLDSWHAVCEKYCAAFNWEQAPWCYSERPGIGMLSGAVWQSNGIALEEFKVEKTKKGVEKPSNGRCDLYFGLPSEAGCPYKHFDVEGKHCWIELTSDFETGRKKISKCLKKAVEDAATLPKVDSTRLGVAFVTFTAKKESEFKFVKVWHTKLKKFKVKSDNWPHCAIAWYFLNDKYRKSPGAAILIQVVPKD